MICCGATGAQLIHRTAPSIIEVAELLSAIVGGRGHRLDKYCNAKVCNMNRPSVDVASVTSNVRHSDDSLQTDGVSSLVEIDKMGGPHGNISDRGCVVDAIVDEEEWWLMVVLAFGWLVVRCT